MQDDSLKGSMVKVCLALKNGFQVATGEILQLIRRATASQFDKDPSMRPYYKVIRGSLRLFGPFFLLKSFLLDFDAAFQEIFWITTARKNDTRLDREK